MQVETKKNFSSCNRPLSDAFRLALLDLDGVVYRGGNAVEYASDSILFAQKIMKKILLIALLGASNLFAQQQQDSILVKEIPTIKNNVFQQRQEINALTKKLNNDNIGYIE